MKIKVMKKCGVEKQHKWEKQKKDAREGSESINKRLAATL